MFRLLGLQAYTGCRELARNIANKVNIAHGKMRDSKIP